MTSYSVTSPAIIQGTVGNSANIQLANSGSTVVYSLKAPATVVTPYTLTLPASSTAPNLGLATDGAGTTAYSSFSPLVWYFRDEKGAGVNGGGNIPSTGWYQRDLNTAVTPPGGFDYVTLVGNTVVLKEGSYLVTTTTTLANASGLLQGNHMRILNVTTGAKLYGGTSTHIISSGPGFASHKLFSIVIITVGAGLTNTIQVEVLVATSASNEVYGSGAGFANNVYTEMKVTKLA